MLSSVWMVNKGKSHRDPMLFVYWASVIDGGPTLKQHWVNESAFFHDIHDIRHNKVWV